MLFKLCPKSQDYVVGTLIRSRGDQESTIAMTTLCDFEIGGVAVRWNLLEAVLIQEEVRSLYEEIESIPSILQSVRSGLTNCFSVTTVPDLIERKCR